VSESITTTITTAAAAAAAAATLYFSPSTPSSLFLTPPPFPPLPSNTKEYLQNNPCPSPKGEMCPAVICSIGPWPVTSSCTHCPMIAIYKDEGGREGGREGETLGVSTLILEG